MLIIPTGISLRFKATIKTPDGNPVTDLDTADSVVIRIKAPAPAVAVSLTATIDDAEAGKIHADALPAQLAALGDWSAWAVATWSSGRILKTHGAAFRIVAEGTVVVCIP